MKTSNKLIVSNGWRTMPTGCSWRRRGDYILHLVPSNCWGSIPKLNACGSGGVGVQESGSKSAGKNGARRAAFGAQALPFKSVPQLIGDQAFWCWTAVGHFPLTLPHIASAF